MMKRSQYWRKCCVGLGLAVLVAAGGCDPADPAASASAGAAAPGPRVVADTAIDAGRYLVRIAGCNDCHTDGVMAGRQVPEEQWLTGMGMGFHGPWGTTYPGNLRLFVQGLTADQFVQAVRARSGLPPMPWESLHAMHDRDLRNIYAYLKHLGPAGEPVPAALPPGQTPKTPYIVMTPVAGGDSADASKPAAP